MKKTRLLAVLLGAAMALAGAVVPSSTATAAAPRAGAACIGDDGGTHKVQVLYVRSPAGADRYAEMADKFGGMANEIGNVVNKSALKTGGELYVRYVRNSDCAVNIGNVVVSSTTNIMDFDAVVRDLESKGYNRADRKYLIFAQTAAFCGLAAHGTFDSGPSYAMVGSGCWSWNAAGHELLHTLGAVNPNAPHGTPGGHCWDDPDIMCYDDDDKPATYPLQDLCPKAFGDDIDCNSDDYFSANPPAGTWLANNPRSNVAKSPFLTALTKYHVIYTGEKAVTTARAGATAYVTKYQSEIGWTAKAKIVTSSSSPFYSSVLAVRTSAGTRYVPPAGVPRGSAAHVTIDMDTVLDVKLCEGNATAKSGCTATWW
ncbi:hypothetical protein ACFS5L_40495 [Streptomyces phyllanthi]|uniref:Peptidase M43 pregnancy-associated plasma-A domain-containing protein n=1 Tax=Streptomyces phyllanthi TaxID=1803180 RepID=A0A5N8VYJ0_9ACTN|nr:hypothetical protein [Streptomyces phyllanthi]MPY38995.1 hypothetical protein [Streptomyces phyllanthi]